jgi:hypothetical protein
VGSLVFWVGVVFTVLWSYGTTHGRKKASEVGLGGAIIAVLVGLFSFGIAKDILYMLLVASIAATSKLMFFQARLYRFMKIASRETAAAIGKIHVKEQIDRIRQVDPERAELNETELDAMTSSDMLSWKADQVTNGHDKQLYSISTVIRKVSMQSNGFTHDSVVETAVFKGADTYAQPVVQIDWIGGAQKEVRTLHNLVKNIAATQSTKYVSSLRWWDNLLQAKGFSTEQVTEWVDHYHANHTIILVEKA